MKFKYFHGLKKNSCLQAEKKLFFCRCTLKFIIAFSASAIAISVNAKSMKPVARIPLLTQPVTIDGKMSKDEWKDAAVIRRIFYKRNRIPANPKTEFYIKYDENNLYLAAVCHEDQKGYPEAYPRKWDDLLFRNDDAVQLVLGVKDKNVAVGEKIDMGGYEGAMDGKSAKADFYYCYTVNAVGSQQRTFNETLLRNSLFEAKVGEKTGNKWVVEIKIPFDSCGIKNVQGQTVFANLFRFRPPVMAGWNYSNFWGYAAMPFGSFTFLPEGKGALRTIEKYAETPAPPAKKCTATIQYSPLSGAIIGKVYKSGKWGKLYGVLQVPGFKELKQELEFHVKMNHDAIPEIYKPHLAAVIQPIKPGDQPDRKATFKVVDENGKTVAKVAQDCKAVKAPEWLGTKNGIEYVNKKFPAPWTLPVVSGDSVKLLDKTIKFNKFCLPSSIVFKSDKKELLAAEPYISVTVAGKKLKFGNGKVVSKVIGNSCISTSTIKTGNIVLEAKSKLEPDGFTLVKFKLDNISPEAVQQVSLKIPLKNEDARFIMPGVLVQKTANLGLPGYRNAASLLWVGTYDKGLSFNYDTPLFFSKNIRHQIEVTRDGNITWLTFNFCDGPGQIDKNTVFRFFLQPTPTKPQMDKYVYESVDWKWERWGRWHGYPDVSKIPELKKWTTGLKKSNQLGLLYTCQGLQVDSPCFLPFRSDLELQPQWRYYKNKGQYCWATSKRGPEGDLQLWGWKKLINEGGVRGFVSDGLIPAWGDSNPAHWAADSYGLPVSWKNDMVTRVVGQRNFLKRLCGMFTDTGEPYCVVAHTGGGIDVNTMSFADGYLEGEQLSRFKKGYYLPLPVFAVGYSGYPWGWRTIFWGKRWRNYQSMDRSLAYTMLFNAELASHNDLVPRDLALDILYAFPVEKTTFIPFWKKNDYVSINNSQGLSSTYICENKAMVVVSNLNNTKLDYKLDLSNLFPGKKLLINEILSNKEMKGRVLSGSIVPHSCDLYKITAEDAAAKDKSPDKSEPLVKIDKMDGGDWTVNVKSPGVEKKFPVSFAGVDNLMMINSKPKKALATAQMSKFALKGDATVKLLIIPQLRFKIYWGKVNICHDHGWFIREGSRKVCNPVMNRFMDIGFSKPHEILMTVKDGRFYVWYDQKVIVDGYPVNPESPVKPLSLSTWHDNVLMFKVLSLTNRSVNGPSAPEFNITGFKPKDWKVNTNLSYVHANYNFKLPDGRTGLAFNSSPHKPSAARAVLTQSFGRDLYIDMTIKLTKRFRFNIGSSLIGYGGGWTGYGWFFKGAIENRGNGRVIRDIPLSNNFVPLKISIKDGMLDLVYNNMVVIEKLPVKLSAYGNSFSMETWWNDKIEFTVGKISSKPEKIIINKVNHPVVK